MADYRASSFKDCMAKLDSSVQRQFRRAYLEYRRNPQAVKFEQKGRMPSGIPVYGARIDGNFRALASVKNGDVIWFWAGTHTDYDRLLTKLKLSK